MMHEFIASLLATSPIEAASVLSGLGYAVLAVQRKHWCWVLGGASSALLAYLYARARLPMQSTLQLYYIAMAFFGFFHWSREGAAAVRVTRLPLLVHVTACAAIVAAAALTASWLAGSASAWPYLDSLTTWASLFATWLAARMKLENWLYWIAIDILVAVISAAQGLAGVALLYVAYAGIAVVGFLAWLGKYRTPPSLAAEPP
jgi:nicotinamide mononucleotide transporter